MARQLRIEYAGACYHVMNRGNQRSRVFHSATHHRLFHDRLERFALQFDVAIHCYCLMPNHFHVVLTTHQANLSRFMQSWLTSFTVSMNRMRHSAGHVFQGRFKAQLVESQRYTSELSRYVHLNPVRTKRATQLSLAQRRALLHDFKWSSFGALIGLWPTPEWMDVGPVLETWGTAPEERMKNYRGYVEQGLTVDLPNPFLSVKEQSILGSDSFVDRVRRRYLLTRTPPSDGEQPALEHLVHSLDPFEVISEVARLYGVSSDELRRRRSSCRDGRRLAMYLTAIHCRRTHSLTHLASLFSVTVGALCTTRARVETALGQRRNKALRERRDHVLAAMRCLDAQNC